MIDIKDKKMCCGCSACLDVCPARCIAWREDEEGFRYPVVDLERCMHCDVCENVCPVPGPLPAVQPERIVAARNSDDTVRASSSSGGLFSVLAESVLARGGVVYGAVFDEKWLVHHAPTTDMEGVSRIRGSKYMQSRMDGILREIQSVLREGRPVLFSGTSCQTAGARKLLGRNPKLLLVDVACHSVPSPKVWEHYMHEKLSAGGFGLEDVTRISFRDKSRGWRNFSVVISARKGDAPARANITGKFEVDGYVAGEVGADRTASDGNKNIVSEPSRDNSYMRGFIKGLYSRPACAVCPAKAFASGADITIADFWGEEEFFADPDDRGTTLAFALTHKGMEVLSAVSGETLVTDKKSLSDTQQSLVSNSVASFIDVTLEQAVKHNPRIMSPLSPHPKRSEFFARLSTTPVEESVKQCTKRTLKERIAKYTIKTEK